MSSEHPASHPRTYTPVERALFEAALQAAGSLHPSFIDEIDWRLGRATNALDRLTSLLGNAEFHEFEVPAAGLYGIAGLILNELKTVQVLCERRDKIELQSTKEVAR